MKILVLGGSYFFGRWFVEMARSKHEVTVANRGNIPLNLPGVREIKLDRQNPETYKALEECEPEVVVDFCAYNPGDIAAVVNALPCKGYKYIFISTVDVYKKGTGKMLTFDAPLEERMLSGEVGQYITGKVLLEKELKNLSSQAVIKGISVRPGILYGPANYAPREGLYLQWIEKAGQIISPVDSTGFFQFVYVADAAKALVKLCESDTEYTALNFVNKESDTYESFEAALHEAVGMDFERVTLPVSEIIEKQIPLPFPLTKEESERYDAMNFSELCGSETSLAQGLKKSFGK